MELAFDLGHVRAKVDAGQVVAGGVVDQADRADALSAKVDRGAEVGADAPDRLARPEMWGHGGVGELEGAAFDDDELADAVVDREDTLLRSEAAHAFQALGVAVDQAEERGGDPVPAADSFAERVEVAVGDVAEVTGPHCGFYAGGGPG